MSKQDTRHSSGRGSSEGLSLHHSLSAGTEHPLILRAFCFAEFLHFSTAPAQAQNGISLIRTAGSI